jgi:hypothetical protein
MTATDERVRRALRALAAETESGVDSEAALAAVLRSHRRVPSGVWLGLAAAGVAALAVTAVTVADNRNEVVVNDNPVATTAPAPATTAAPTTAPAPTTVPASGDLLAGATVDPTGIGPLRVGMTLDELPGWEQDFPPGASCGQVTPRPDTWDRMHGYLREGDDGVYRVTAVYTSDATIRTAEGMGVGSTLDELRATYGDRLIERVPELDATGVNVQTEPPRAFYGPVATIFQGDTAITFWLDPSGSGSVWNVKVSVRDFAGDDDGCAP